MITPDTIEEISNAILLKATTTDFKGYDPFDYLNSSLFQKSGLQNIALCRLAWIQLGKRLPFNLRPYVGVKPERNPKGIALFILGLTQDYYRTQDIQYIEKATELADWLLTQQSDPIVWTYPAWGYHFDWQARAFFVPKGKPNIITTCYVARALLELGNVTDREDYKTTAYQSARFIVESLLTIDSGRTFFAYIPGEIAFVHNASLWGAAWVTQVANLTNDVALFKVATSVAEQSLQEQANDGSWVYGSRHHHQFIDGFHTGFNLEALRIIQQYAMSPISGLDEAIDKGLNFYRVNHFTDNGVAKYYHDNVFPLDMHNFSQAILTFLKVSRETSDIELVKKVIQQAIAQLYIRNESRFVYQKYKNITNSVDYMRWTQAWAYYGFAYWNCFTTKSKDTRNCLGHSLDIKDDEIHEKN